ncbi:hypothetical protein P171DRAFT_368535 [Karstenula rhodostoma CBS 690.94]|uniref:Oxidase ustYa n=1 Tax=Karstenula rhodostoma CBS 690.94 TaxID=1392251 RepID=A0A9P4U851_9PLEO|nr:hypothetical protein P171DRAFT_368535 [Karstenula rhodostoma CBS 690.94]
MPDIRGAVTVASVYRTFTYNRTYSEAPSKATTDPAWAALFPLGGTFFTHPKIARNVSTFSVYHQLHCIDAIRQGYWAVVEAAAQGRTPSDADTPAMGTLPHIRHCLDLLRQSIMCHGDTTLEVVDPRVKGVHGFGVKHRCRDWGQLVHWTEQWNDIPPEEDA